MSSTLKSLVFSAVILVVLGSRETVRHQITLNPEAHKRGAVIKIQAKINEFLDIDCPQYDEDHHGDEARFVIHKLSKEQYAACALSNSTKVFKCNNPKEGRKLTAKFQKVSPNPLGFVFTPNEKYYFVALPPDDKSKCDEGIVLEVSVFEKDSIVVPSETKPTKKIPVVPDLVEITTKAPTTTLLTTIIKKAETKMNTPEKSRQKGGDGGNFAIAPSSGLFLIFLALLTNLWLQT